MREQRPSFRSSRVDAPLFLLLWGLFVLTTSFTFSNRGDGIAFVASAAAKTNAAATSSEKDPDGTVAFATTFGKNASKNALFDAILSSVKRSSSEKEFETNLKLLRRRLHERPELMWTETETSALIKKELDALSISYEDAAKPGILATIALDGDMDVSKKSSKNKIAVLLRADMDALLSLIHI